MSWKRIETTDCDEPTLIAKPSTLLMYYPGLGPHLTVIGVYTLSSQHFPQNPRFSSTICLHWEDTFFADTIHIELCLVVTYVSNHSEIKQKHTSFEWDLCLFLTGYLSCMLHYKDELINTATYLVLDASRHLSNILQTMWKPQLVVTRNFAYVKDFLFICRLVGEPVNLREQHDALEFFNSVVDSLDEALKAVGASAIFMKCLGGSYADQKICKGCPHR